MKYIFAPHLDDEILGCYSILKEINYIIYFTSDYRTNTIQDNRQYIYYDDFDFKTIKSDDYIYLPSQYDYHPKHKEVNKFGYTIDAIRNFYSIEMNVPWLEEEKHPTKKREIFNEMYPGEDMKSDKYFLFKSIKSYDSYNYFSTKYTFNDFTINIDISDVSKIMFSDSENKNITTIINNNHNITDIINKLNVLCNQRFDVVKITVNNDILHTN